MQKIKRKEPPEFKKFNLKRSKNSTIKKVYQGSFVSYLNLLSSVLVIIISIMLVYLINSDYFNNRCFVEMYRPENKNNNDQAENNQSSQIEASANATDLDQVNTIEQPVEMPQNLLDNRITEPNY